MRKMAVLNHRDEIEVLTRWKVAQFESFTDHVWQVGFGRRQVMKELIAHAALKLGRAECGCADGFEFVAGLCRVCHDLFALWRGQCMSGSPAGAPSEVTRKPKSQPASACWIWPAAIQT